MQRQTVVACPVVVSGNIVWEVQLGVGGEGQFLGVWIGIENKVIILYMHAWRFFLFFF